MLTVYRRSAHQLVSNSNDDREYSFLFRRIFSYGLPVTYPRMWLPASHQQLLQAAYPRPCYNQIPTGAVEDHAV